MKTVALTVGALALLVAAPPVRAQSTPAVVVTACSAISGLPTGPGSPLYIDQTGSLCTTAGGGGGGGAVTVADGADVTQGAIADAASAPGGTGTVSAKLREATALLNSILSGVNGSIPAGSATIGSIAPLVVTPTDRAGTITTGGTAQNAMAANSSRRGWCIQNPSTATETLQVRSGTAATTTTGVNLLAGQQACNLPGQIDQGIISVVAATTGHAWLGTEYQ